MGATACHCMCIMTANIRLFIFCRNYSLRQLFKKTLNKKRAFKSALKFYDMLEKLAHKAAAMGYFIGFHISKVDAYQHRFCVEMLDGQVG